MYVRHTNEPIPIVAFALLSEPQYSSMVKGVLPDFRKLRVRFSSGAQKCLNSKINTKLKFYVTFHSYDSYHHQDNNFPTLFSYLPSTQLTQWGS